MEESVLKELYKRQYDLNFYRTKGFAIITTIRLSYQNNKQCLYEFYDISDREALDTDFDLLSRIILEMIHKLDRRTGYRGGRM